MFSQEKSAEELAEAWVSQYQDDSSGSSAMCDLVNFVIKCTGCDLQIDAHDIEDPDNATGKISDLQDEYQAQNITEYPLISKAKAYHSFRYIMTNFISTLIATAHASGVLHQDPDLIESIQVWVFTMSSSAIRPFRHTATAVSMTIANTICTVVNEIAISIANSMRQRDAEQKRSVKKINKERIAAFQAKISEGQRKKEAAEGWLKDVFDAVFVHRYRDVDPKIRVECTSALGTWIVTCPEIFFESQYLRYLGWTLSDTNSSARAEVVKQLSKLLKNKEDLGRVRAFIERFRPRIVEMATHDAEPSIRASAVELLDQIREAGLLEPDDIDTIGKLVFDTEARVRKAVSGFFAENINDLFEATIEELGGDEALDEVVGDGIEDDYETSQKTWLKLKCLVEVLQSYDPEDGEESFEPGMLGSRDLLVAGEVESRFSLAAHAICEGVPEVKNWEVLAGYLLFDHSSLSENNASDDTLQAFKVRCQLNEREEILLLEVLNAAVKFNLTHAAASETDKKGKPSKARKEKSREIQETTALHLAQVIPRLLRKFGANSATASAVLRLQHVLDLEIFQELRQDSTEYASLLDDINKQFLSHADHTVLADASTALLHARSFEDLEEVTESKLQQLWQDTINSLRELVRNKSRSHLTSLSDTIHRISSLASISDCVTYFDLESPLPSRTTANTSPTTPLLLLINLINTHASSTDFEVDAQEGIDALLTSAMKALLFYYMWKCRALQSDLSATKTLSTSTSTQLSHTDFSTSLLLIITNRPPLSPVRLIAINTLLDLYTLFATFRHTNLPRRAPPNQPSIQSLVQPIPPSAQSAITKSFLAAEKSYAKKSSRTLERPNAADDNEEASAALDSEPEEPSSDEDDEDDNSDNENEELQSRKLRRKQQDSLLAEKRLCELAGKMVLAVVGRALGGGSEEATARLKKRLVRNRGKLGANFKEVCRYLDGGAEGGKGRKKGGKGMGVGKKGKGKDLPRVVVVENDEEDEEDPIEEVGVEEGGREDLRRRELDDGIIDDEGEGGEPAEQGGDAADAADDDEIMGD